MVAESKNLGLATLTQIKPRTALLRQFSAQGRVVLDGERSCPPGQGLDGRGGRVEDRRSFGVCSVSQEDELPSAARLYYLVNGHAGGHEVSEGADNPDIGTKLTCGEFLAPTVT